MEKSWNALPSSPSSRRSDCRRRSSPAAAPAMVRARRLRAMTRAGAPMRSPLARARRRRTRQGRQASLPAGRAPRRRRAATAAGAAARLHKVRSDDTAASAPQRGNLLRSLATAEARCFAENGRRAGAYGRREDGSRKHRRSGSVRLSLMTAPRLGDLRARQAHAARPMRTIEGIHGSTAFHWVGNGFYVSTYFPSPRLPP